jgi:crotonobetainyl-CoA:carnitine CoA-transferase CaiB-like acyl-CoA transferase
VLKPWLRRSRRGHGAIDSKIAAQKGERLIMPARPELPERMPRPKGDPTALDGLLVIDFTRVVAGPACTQTLADFGAHVIKIENPEGGDDTRAYEHAETGGQSAAFLSLNRNKRGIALDFTNPAALEVARELIAKADVVVENFSGGVMKKFGLDYASVQPTNPRLVYCSISAYGREGAFALRPGFDPITQAESGFMSLNGFADGPALRTGPPIVDLATGMSACNAILLALMAREKVGRGQHVEVALYDIAMAMTGFYGMAYLISGENPGRFGNSPNGSPTVGVYEASDGPLYMACANDRLVRRLITEVFGRPELMTDPRFESRKARTANKDELRAVIAGIFKQDKLETWMAKMKKANVPVGHLRTVEQGFNAPEARERRRLSKIPHPTAGSVPNIEPPIKMAGTPTVDPVAAPLLGEHTNDVLRKTLGYDDRRLATLAEVGAFGKTASGK